MFTAAAAHFSAHSVDFDLVQAAKDAIPGLEGRQGLGQREVHRRVREARAPRAFVDAGDGPPRGGAGMTAAPGPGALTPDELLTTTRTVRKRLDLTGPCRSTWSASASRSRCRRRPAPTAQGWHWVVVTDPSSAAPIGDVYRRAVDGYLRSAASAGRLFEDDPERGPVQRRVGDSVAYLGEHMGEVPVLVIPCLTAAGSTAGNQAGLWGSLLPAAWSYMLAARARGLGTAWTTLHLRYEEEVAELLGLPADVRQGVLSRRRTTPARRSARHRGCRSTRCCTSTAGDLSPPSRKTGARPACRRAQARVTGRRGGGSRAHHPIARPRPDRGAHRGPRARSRHRRPRPPRPRRPAPTTTATPGSATWSSRREPPAGSGTSPWRGS